jgi:hypothetical protein
MTITYRGVKDEALTYGELDENFRDLRQDTDLERVLINGNVANLTITVPQVITNVSFVGGSNVTEAFIATNNYTLQVGAASNAWSNVQIADTGLAANNYAIQIGAASNAWSNVQIAATGLAANAYALSISTSSGSSSNSYTIAVGIAGNNYTNAVGISVGIGANNWSNTIGISVGAGANVYPIAVGNAANNWSNTKLSNSSITISGGLKMSDIHLLSNVTVTLSSNVGNVGQVSWDGNYLYVCVATNLWRRTQLLSW